MAEKLQARRVGDCTTVADHVHVRRRIDDRSPALLGDRLRPRRLERERPDDHPRRPPRRRYAASTPTLARRSSELRGPPWQPDTSNPFDSWAFTGIPVIPFPAAGCVAAGVACSRRSTRSCSSSRCRSPNRTRRATCTNATRRASPRLRCPPGSSSPAPAAISMSSRGSSSATRTSRARVRRSSRCSTLAKEGVRRTSVSSAAARSHAAWCRRRSGRAPSSSCPSVAAACRTCARYDKACNNRTGVALLLGAYTNEWFPVTRSVLSIPAASNPLGQLVAEHFSNLSEAKDKESLSLLLKVANQLKPLRAFDLSDVWTAVEERTRWRRRRQGRCRPAAPRVGRPDGSPAVAPPRAPTSSFERSMPDGYDNLMAPTVLVKRLREVVDAHRLRPREQTRIRCRVRRRSIARSAWRSRNTGRLGYPQARFTARDCSFGSPRRRSKRRGDQGGRHATHGGIAARSSEVAP